LIKINKEKEDLNNILQKINYNLFIEIDKDFDGKLSSKEIGEFINKLMQLKSSENTEKIITKGVNDSTLSFNKEVTDYILNTNANSLEDLFANEQQIIPYDNSSINNTIEKRKKQLSALGIKSLKDEAIKVGIKSVSRFKNTPEDKQKLINLILFKKEI